MSGSIVQQSLSTETSHAAGRVPPISHLAPLQSGTQSTSDPENPTDGLSEGLIDNLKGIPPVVESGPRHTVRFLTGCGVCKQKGFKCEYPEDKRKRTRCDECYVRVPLATVVHLLIGARLDVEPAFPILQDANIVTLTV
ncbi:MAG: hypothetical protein Q9227_008285 [Pyrenula ochraceoflavens]